MKSDDDTRHAVHEEECLVGQDLEGQDDDFGLAFEPDDAFVGRTIRGILVEQLLDEGGMGRVYRGLQIDLGVPVAVKVIRPEVLSATALTRFQSEMRLLARLEHVGIPRIKFADVWEGQPYFVMDFIPEARDLVTFAKEQQLTLRQKLELFQRVCDAVGFGHLAGVIHRDLKPKNILVDDTGQPKVIDFGIAQLQDQAESIDESGAGMRQPGSPAYMSPEQWGCHDAGEPDVRTDVYSLGIVLYELLADRRPYQIEVDAEGADRQAAVRAAACDQQPIPLTDVFPGISEDVWAITACCLAKDPEARYTNARELGQDVARCLRGEPVHANPPGPWRIIAHLVNRHRAAVLAMLAAVGLIGGALGWVAYERGRIDEARMEELNRLLVSFDSIERILADMRDRVDVLVPDDHARAVRMLRMIADHQGRLGSWSRATDTLRVALERMRHLSSAEIGSEVEYQVRSELVRAQLQADQPGNALTDATALVEWLERQQESDQGRRLDALGMQAVACRHAAQLTEAIEIGEQIVPQLVELRGDGHVETLQAMNNLAVAERRVGKTDAAHDRLLEIHERAVASLGDKHPDTLQFAHNLAIAKLSLGRKEEAEEILGAVWDARRMKYGDRHWATIATLTELCRLLRKRGDASGIVQRLHSLEPSLREVVSDFDGQVSASCIRLLEIGRWAFDQAGGESRVEEIDVMLMSAGQEPPSGSRPL